MQLSERRVPRGKECVLHVLPSRRAPTAGVQALGYLEVPVLVLSGEYTKNCAGVVPGSMVLSDSGIATGILHTVQPPARNNGHSPLLPPALLPAVITSAAAVKLHTQEAVSIKCSSYHRKAGKLAGFPQRNFARERGSEGAHNSWEALCSGRQATSSPQWVWMLGAS